MIVFAQSVKNEFGIYLISTNNGCQLLSFLYIRRIKFI